MKVCLTLICLLFLTALQDGETVRTFRGKEGGNIKVRCEFDYSGTKRFLCKKTCEGENILIETTKERDERGRFSIRYQRRSATKSDFLHVSITDLKPSDSGRYRCRSDETFAGTLYDHFDLVVTEDSSKPKWTPRTFLGSIFLPTASTTTKTTSTQSFSPSETIKLSEKPAAASGQQLYLILSNVVKIVLLATPLVIFCWKRRTMKSKDSAVETENADEIFTIYS
ncbi:natural cytotoxicity triggering receptor 2-like [Gambusia affinis]|uniref:natural cytotoxicity triggering receptor 2-like n=1 Tax=Gambusia affinis TaxID=33528 RepID=UPI001CDC81A6|nr:natural cytotoxicity triggering receptor 2-like [Gambusia affinis]